MSPTQPGTRLSSARELCEKLTDPDKNVRYEAAMAVGTRCETECADPLVNALWTEPDFFVRETMTWAVLRLEEDTRLAVLAAVATDQSPDVRTRALHVLSKFANPETVDAVLAHINDPDAVVARKARWALSRIREPRAVPHLVALLGEHEAEERNALTDDVAAFGSAAIEFLVEALASDVAAVRLHAADVLCYIGHPDAEQAADQLGAAVRDREVSVAIAALMALGELRGGAAQKHMEQARDSPVPQLRTIAERLATRKPKRALQARRTAPKQSADEPRQT